MSNEGWLWDKKHPFPFCHSLQAAPALQTIPGCIWLGLDECSYKNKSSFLVKQVKLNCSTAHSSLCICPSEHEMLKLPITLTRGLIFKELTAINQVMRSKWCVKMQFKEAFFLRYSLKFSFSVWWMLRLPGRATRKTWGIMHYDLLHSYCLCCLAAFLLSSVISEISVSKGGLALTISEKWCYRKLWGFCGLLKSYKNLTAFYLPFYPYSRSCDWTKFKSCLQ